jgi:hypothetical protein
VPVRTKHDVFSRRRSMVLTAILVLLLALGDAPLLGPLDPLAAAAATPVTLSFPGGLGPTGAKSSP